MASIPCTSTILLGFVVVDVFFCCSFRTCTFEKGKFSNNNNYTKRTGHCLREYLAIKKIHYGKSKAKKHGANS